MKNIEIKISKETRKVELNKYIIGNEGENLQGNLIFSFVDDFVNGQARLEYQISGNKYYAILEKNDETYQTPILSVITKKGQIDMQLVITEGIDETEIPIFKSNIFYLTCNASINSETEQPDEYEQWIEIANTKLNQVDNVDIDITTIDDTTRVEITKKDGTKKSAIVSDGTGTITDVKVDGTSVVTDGVANISLSDLDNVLRDILEVIQSGISTSMIIEEIEQLIVSYFENKTVEEVEA